MTAAKAPLGPRRFDYDQLSDDDFELLVYLVVLLEHSDAIRLRAPDKGADAALPEPDGAYSHCWQSKRFTKQVSWPQCKASLDSAVGSYRMPRYTFCFARDLTGGQEALFTKHLRTRHAGVQVDWWGSSKLTAFLLGSEQGKRIEAHFYGDPAVDTQAFMRALRAGGELTTGTDAVARLIEIADFFESKDPFFSYTLSTRSPSLVPHAPATPGAVMSVELTTAPDRTVRIDAVPRNRAAYERLPQGQLRFADTPEGAAEYAKFRAALIAGGEATLSTVWMRFENLPAGLEAFAPDDVPMQVNIRAPKRPPRPWDARVRVQTDRGDASLDVDLRPVEPPKDWDGALSATANGLTMNFLLRMRNGRGQSKVDWRYTATGGSVSGQARALALIDAAQGVGTMTIEERGVGERRFQQTVTGQEPDERVILARRLLDDLHAIEEWIGEPFVLPDDWPTVDFGDLPEIAQMIRTGERVGCPSMTLRVPHERRDEIYGDRFPVWVSQGVGISLFGVEHPIGYLSGGFDGRVARAESVVEDGEELIEIEIEAADPSSEVAFKLTREERPPPA